MEKSLTETIKSQILEGMKQSSNKLIERKILMKQKIAISNQGKVKLVSPKKLIRE